MAESKKNTEMSFSTALERMKGGETVTRIAWEKAVGMPYPKVFLKFGIMFKADDTQRPQSIKASLFNRGTEGMRVILPCLCLFTDGLEVDGWAPSTLDLLAEDWIVIN